MYLKGQKISVHLVHSLPGKLSDYTHTIVQCLKNKSISFVTNFIVYIIIYNIYQYQCSSISG